jgi:hypothetical protein
MALDAVSPGCTGRQDGTLCSDARRSGREAATVAPQAGQPAGPAVAGAGPSGELTFT